MAMYVGKFHRTVVKFRGTVGGAYLRISDRLYEIQQIVPQPHKIMAFPHTMHDPRMDLGGAVRNDDNRLFKKVSERTVV